MEMFVILIVVMVSQMLPSVKTDTIVHLEYVQFIVLQIYLNKIEKKILFDLTVPTANNSIS